MTHILHTLSQVSLLHVFSVQIPVCIPVNTTRLPNVVLMLAQRLTRWSNNETTLSKRVLFACVARLYQWWRHTLIHQPAPHLDLVWQDKTKTRPWFLGEPDHLPERLINPYNAELFLLEPWRLKGFYPWGIVVPFVRRLRRRRTHSFGYYTNMVQQIKFIIHTNIQPLPALFFTQGQGHRSKVKGQGQRFNKILVNAITWKIIIGSLQFFTWSYPWVNNNTAWQG